ncbi:hypothetical protein K438DRAFT_1778438 [Mycena galopus ATCC 62051]|nr:hypothetical protein K438DRAFT_1778438 [Mycena galopus ATCC 62051]
MLNVERWTSIGAPRVELAVGPLFEFQNPDRRRIFGRDWRVERTARAKTSEWVSWSESCVAAVINNNVPNTATHGRQISGHPTGKDANDMSEVGLKPAPNTYKDAHRHISSFAFRFAISPGRSDVLADLRVNVMLEGSGKVLWFKSCKNVSWKTRKSSSTTKPNGSSGRCTGRGTGGISASARAPSRPARSSPHPPRPNSPHPPGMLLFESHTNAPLPHTHSLMLTFERALIHVRRRYEPADSPPTPTASALSRVMRPPTPASVHAQLERAQAVL